MVINHAPAHQIIQTSKEKNKMLYVIKKANGELRSEAMYLEEDAKAIVEYLNHTFGDGSYYYEAA